MSKSFFIFATLCFSFVSSANAELRLLVSRKPGVNNNASIEKLLSRREVLHAEPVFTALEKRFVGELRASHLADAQIVYVDGEEAEKRLLNYIKANALPLRVENSEIDLSMSPVHASPLAEPSGIASEPFEMNQWALQNTGEHQSVELDHMNSFWVPARKGEDLNMDLEQELTQRFPAKKKIIVAILDTGVDTGHPDLKDKIVTKPSECAALEKFRQCTLNKKREECELIWMDPKNPEVDLDRNGYPMDCKGWTLLGGLNKAQIMGRPDYEDTEGHGTHVAGIIGASTRNQLGIRGCSDNIEILPVQVLGKNPGEPVKPLSTDPVDTDPTESKRKKPRELSDIVARGLIYAIRSGANVINFSMGWPAARDSQFMRDLIAEAQRRGIVIVAAAGNDSTKSLLMPCGYPGVLCVGAHGPDGAISHFSNYGSAVDLAAPGLNILSTWPMKKRPIRFRANYGYEFLHGTSQACPYVSCLVGELLARDIPANEAAARLILGARAHKEPLDLLRGGPHLVNLTEPQTKLLQELYKKNTLSGNADFSRALKVEEQPLIIPAEKENAVIPWDRKSDTLQWKFKLRNLWLTTGNHKIEVRAEIMKPASAAVRPRVTAITSSQAGAWITNEVREFTAVLKIEDGTTPGQSRIPSELQLDVQVYLDGKEIRRFVLRGEIIVQLSDAMEGAYRIPVLNLPKVRYTMLPVDLILDDKPQFQDYLLAEYGEQEWTYYLLAQDQNGDAKQTPYEIRGNFKIPAPKKEDAEKMREQIVARIDVDGSGNTQYVLGLMTENSDADEPTPSPITFYYLNDRLQLKHTTIFDSKLAQVPYDTTGMQVQWMKLATRKVPSWIGFGKDPYKKRSTREMYRNPHEYEAPDIRFYYLDEEGALQSLMEYEGYRLIDVLRPSRKHIHEGRVPVILAKNRGTSLKFSYLYDFARAEIFEGKIVNFQKIDYFSQGIPYRNLLNTRVDAVFSLDYGPDLFSGTYWFSTERQKMQRLSLLLNNAGTAFYDYHVPALRGVVDSALWVRSAFTSKNGVSAFILTNSEIQFHDFATGDAAFTSLDRYTFYQDMLTTSLQFPLMVKDSTRPYGPKLPSLYTTEGSGFTRGVKITVPYYDKDGRVIELGAPAKLRLQSHQGCKPLDTPVWGGENEPYYFDYFCGSQFLRIPLSF